MFSIEFKFSFHANDTYEDYLHRLPSYLNRTFSSKERGLDRASESGSLVKESKSMTPVLDVNNISCDKKLLPVSVYNSERESTINLHKAS